MPFQTVFQRYELKYLLTNNQKNRILEAIAPYMKPDEYGSSTIRNVYYDTEDYRLARHSIEKPSYKEKLRIRSYEQTTGDSTVFVELKKKYQGVVYKRRLALSEDEADAWINQGNGCKLRSQIAREIEYFRMLYPSIQPVAFISYDRAAYHTERKDFRVTFDDNILCRTSEISLEEPIGGEPILEECVSLMEIKCAGGIPFWLLNALSENEIYKTSFSKYGTAYKKLIIPSIKKEVKEDLDYV